MLDVLAVGAGVRQHSVATSDVAAPAACAGHPRARAGRREEAARRDDTAPEKGIEMPIMKPKSYQLPLLCTS